MSLSAHLLEALDHKHQVEAYTAQFPNARSMATMPMPNPPPTPLRSVDAGAPGASSARQAAIQNVQSHQNLQNPSFRKPQQPPQTGQNGKPVQQPFTPQYIISSGPTPQFSNLPSDAYGPQHGAVNPYMPSTSDTQQGLNPHMTQMAPAANASYKANGFGNGGGFTAPRLMSEYTVGQLATMQSRLAKKLGPEYITKRPGPGGGPKLSYVEGWKVINLANEVFGFNGWSSQIMSLNTDFIDQTSEGRYNVGISAIIRIILRDGSFHEDTGYGQCDNTKGKGAALDKAKKEAVTDGVKRTLRSFGNVLGNCLYDKEYTKEIEKIKVQPVPLQRRDLWRRPEFEEPESEQSSSGPLPPSCRAHPDIEALNERHLTKQTSGPSIAQSRMQPRLPNGNGDRSDFAVPALPPHTRRTSTLPGPGIVGADARTIGQSIARPMTTALEEEFGMDEEHLVTMDLDDPATMPTGADLAIADTSYDGSVFDQSVDSISVASTAASTVSSRFPQVKTKDFVNGVSSDMKAPMTNFKPEGKSSSDEDEKEAGRRRRRAALLESAQLQQPNGLQTDGYGHSSANVEAKKLPIVGGFRYPGDTTVGNNGSNNGGRSVSDSAATSNRPGAGYDFTSARGSNRFHNSGNDENSAGRGGHPGPPSMQQAQRRPLGELDPDELPFEPGAKRTRA